ncbi:hypothetical protein CC80DRAFT_269802 [Byssothecium circinans]|uniref:Uncharacterized protein n=1 Tax=Byssothecium circinans TaxID=147558 RepID=A0A6A5U8I2_9PLEO|nr:hypothetical protein CC80DRAFT_269802 [Byssothecium circinans]
MDQRNVQQNVQPTSAIRTAVERYLERQDAAIERSILHSTKRKRFELSETISDKDDISPPGLTYASTQSSKISQKEGPPTTVPPQITETTPASRDPASPRTLFWRLAKSA